MNLPNALNYSHFLLTNSVQKNDFVVDATVGNGHDTEFLAQLVGEKGHVIGFDVQKSGLDNTKNRLLKKNLNNVELILDGHQNIENYIMDTTIIGGAIFNLGYLPGADKSIITHGQTTLQAINAILPHLKDNGLIVLVVYYGHDGGQNEVDQLIDFTKNLPQKQYHVLKYEFINQANTPPYVLAIQKR